MITFVSGMPGDGKSYFIMTEIEREIVETNRVIVTNVELDVEAVAASLHESHGKTFDLHSRYFLLSHEQTKKFWLYRGTHELTNGADGRANFLTLQNDKPGVCYVIDELHEHFNARQWSKTGADALTYSSQHRKLGDSVFFISQRAKQVDSQLRSLAGAYVYMRNLANRTLKLGPFTFRFGKTLIARAYPDEWSKGGTEPVLMWSRSMKVDPARYGAWYNTACGVGVKGSKADTVNFPKRGIPWPFIGFGLIVVAFAMWGVPKVLGMVMGKALAPAASIANVAVAEQPVKKPIFQAAPQSTNSIVPLDDLTKRKSFHMSRDGFITIVLTNGLTVTTSDGIEMIGRQGFIYKGRVYPLP